MATATTLQYVLKVKVSDKGNPSLSDTENFIINVIPSNHPPSITPQNPISVRDDAAVGTTITTVIASDSDEGDNGVIMYAITGGNNNEAFSIDMVCIVCMYTRKESVKKVIFFMHIDTYIHAM